MVGSESRWRAIVLPRQEVRRGFGSANGLLPARFGSAGLSFSTSRLIIVEASSGATGVPAAKTESDCPALLVRIGRVDSAVPNGVRLVIGAGDAAGPEGADRGSGEAGGAVLEGWRMSRPVSRMSD